MGGLELGCTHQYIPKFKTVGEAEAESFDERLNSLFFSCFCYSCFFVYFLFAIQK